MNRRYLDEIRETVAREIRGAGLLRDKSPCVPPPSEVEAEMEVCHMLLAGYVTPDRLRPLRAHHLYDALHRLVFEAAESAAERGEVVGLESIVAELVRRDVCGPVERELGYCCGVSRSRVGRRSGGTSR